MFLSRARQEDVFPCQPSPSAVDTPPSSPTPPASVRRGAATRRAPGSPTATHPAAGPWRAAGPGTVSASAGPGASLPLTPQRLTRQRGRGRFSRRRPPHLE